MSIQRQKCNNFIQLYTNIEYVLQKKKIQNRNIYVCVCGQSLFTQKLFVYITTTFLIYLFIFSTTFLSHINYIATVVFYNTPRKCNSNETLGFLHLAHKQTRFIFLIKLNNKYMKKNTNN